MFNLIFLSRAGVDGQAPSGFRATLNNLKKEVKTLEESDDENDGEEKFYPGGFQSFNMQVTSL